MSMFLFDETPIFANPTLAKEIGLNEALILQQLNYWIEVNRKTGKNYHEGRYWTYNSIRAWKEENFDYLSLDTVKRTFARLEKAGYLLTGNFNKDPRDKTKWYAINDGQLEALFWQLREEKNQRESKIRGQVSETTLPNALVQNAPMEKGNLPQCKNAESTHAGVQNRPTHWCSMTQALPEISTEISQEDTIIDLPPSSKGGWEEDDGLIKLKKNIGYNELIAEGQVREAESYLEILTILSDVYRQPNGTVKINQVPLPVELVKSRFDTLKRDHLVYILDVLRFQKSPIQNIRAYLLTLAYNAPTSMEAYYTNRIHQDIGGGYYG